MIFSLIVGKAFQSGIFLKHYTWGKSTISNYNNLFFDKRVFLELVVGFPSFSRHCLLKPFYMFPVCALHVLNFLKRGCLFAVDELGAFLYS